MDLDSLLSSKERRINGSSAFKKKKKKTKTKKIRSKDANKRPRKRLRTPLDVGFKGDLKDMRKLSSNDEAFHLPSMKISEIIDIIHSRKTPTPKTYRQWDQYAVSFYLKMCTCFRVDYQHLEASTSQNDDEENINNGKKPLLPPSPKKIMSLEEQQEQHMLRSGVVKKEGMSYDELMKQEANKDIDGGGRVILWGPFKFGSYPSSATPDRIPYHLYLLVKEAVDIMKRSEWHNNTSDLMDLRIVEQKIRFFCSFFHSHLPTGWNYRRDNASSLVAGYNPTRWPRYCMDGYTPRVELKNGCHLNTCLSERDMADVMSTIHSRKTPNFWEMFWAKISFYCRLCSCFGIDYSCLEEASEDDVRLMDMGRNG